eukprot:scaffold10768_cov24-Cyclotella_meneghiniana.AAC.1
MSLFSCMSLQWPEPHKEQDTPFILLSRREHPEIGLVRPNVRAVPAWPSCSAWSYRCLPPVCSHHTARPP